MAQVASRIVEASVTWNVYVDKHAEVHPNVDSQGHAADPVLDWHPYPLDKI